MRLGGAVEIAEHESRGRFAAAGYADPGPMLHAVIRNREVALHFLAEVQMWRPIEARHALAAQSPLKRKKVCNLKKISCS